jgi:hypothetical protein
MRARCNQEDTMKRALVLSALILVLLPAVFAQRGGRQLSADDQSRFDSYFQRWQNYQRTNNQGDSRSMKSGCNRFISATAFGQTLPIVM